MRGTSCFARLNLPDKCQVTTVRYLVKVSSGEGVGGGTRHGLGIPGTENPVGKTQEMIDSWKSLGTSLDLQFKFGFVKMTTKMKDKIKSFKWNCKVQG